MRHPEIDTWNGKARDPDLSVLDMGKLLGQKTPRAIMGWNGIKVWDKTVDAVAFLAAYLEKAKDESCGQCTPCRLGTLQMAGLAKSLIQGRGKAEDLTRLKFLAVQISRTARCDIGRTLARPVLNLMEAFSEDFEAAAKGTKRAEEGRQYTSLVTAPCVAACPSHLDIPFYLENIRMNRWSEAMDKVREDCPMPGTIGRVCVRPCETRCRRGNLDEPLAIKGLKRFLADREMEGRLTPKPLTAARRPEKVAIVGAGPAGLSCAYYLGRQGIETTIFEAQEGPGGMAAYGIPSYRLPRSVIAHETARVEALGAVIRYNTRVGRDITLEDLAGQGYKAVFVGAGAPGPTRMNCKGEDQGFENFMPGVDFLARAARGEKPLNGSRVAVVGGGNVAMDCVRTALRLGFTDVNLIYRRTEAEMPADPLEIKEAREEGVNFHMLMAPIEVQADAGKKVSGLKCLRMELGEPDKSGRRRPVPIEGSESVMACDAVIPAIGQACAVDQFLPQAVVSEWNTLVVDKTTGQTKVPHIFGGGDCATGPDILIRALAAGKNGAKSIVRFLTTGDCTPGPEDLMEALTEDSALFETDPPLPYPGVTRREEAPVLAPETRVQSFDEVEAGFSPAQARQEANRCLRCYRILVAAL
jgi:formate dehydrogenase beta subunit